MEIVSHKLFVEFLVNDSDMNEFVEFCLIFMVGLGQVVGWVVNLAFKDSHWCNTFFWILFMISSSIQCWCIWWWGIIFLPLQDYHCDLFVINKRWRMFETSCWQKVRRSPNFLIIGELKLLYSTPIPWKQLCITRQFLILILEGNNIVSAPITIVETKMCHYKNPSVSLLLWMLTKIVL